MVVTKREILVSVIMIFIMLCFGLFINSIITDFQMKSNETYNKALKISDDNTMFKYALETSVGNIINYGKFNAEQGVKHYNLKNDYMLIEEITERYTRHIRTSCSGSGKNRTCRTETYYTWDEINTSTNNVIEITFSDVSFDFSMFGNYPKYQLGLSSDSVINEKVDKIKNNCIYETIRFLGANEGDKRYKYYVVEKSFYGTVFGKAIDNNLVSEKGTLTINNTSLTGFIENNKTFYTVIRIFFWIIYIVVCGIGIYYYIYLENNYLED